MSLAILSQLPSITSLPDYDAAKVFVYDTSKAVEGIQYDSPPAAISHYVCLCNFCDKLESEIGYEEYTDVDGGSESGSDGVPGNVEFEPDEEAENEADEMEDQEMIGDKPNPVTPHVEEGCRSISRLKLHIGEVTTILLNCPAIATLHVGASKKTLTCHKALLGFHSEFFDAALYGSFMEGQSGIVNLPEESPDEIATFLTWMYSGTIESKLNAAQLWVLGDRLRTPIFCNDVMYLLINTYGSNIQDGGQWLSASTVDYVYSHTNEHSLLRHFVRDVLRGEGPLCERALEARANDKNDHYRDDWNELIYRGGDLVVDVATVSSFSADKSIDQYGVDIDYTQAPYLPANQHKYVVDVRGTRPIENFVNGVRR